jgi:tRNA A37 threonylcarbamoyladenosine synthetase subunit TsaC/SUA5/YrdC
MTYFLDNIEEVAKLLKSGKKTLLPTDSGWCACYILPESGIDVEDKLREVDDISIMVSDIEMLKMLYPDLHPRIETLLSLHDKPLGLLLPLEDRSMRSNEEGSFIRLAQDDYMKTVIAEVGSPLIVRRLYNGDEAVTSYDDIPAAEMKNADYISKQIKHAEVEALPVLANYNRKAVLDFIRE